AMLTSSQVVNAYAAAMHRARRARWDFEEENPLRDARGFDLARETADASQLTDEDIGLANIILTNGARFYVDHAHPEYSSPEVGMETTLKRPTINTRDEPHADAEKYRRLHVIIGDANLSEVSTYLKLGTTALVLSMIEDGFINVDLVVDQPVRTLHRVSHDPE